METDLIFGAEGDDAVLGFTSGETQLAAVAEFTASFDDPLPQPIDAAQVVIPDGETVVRVPVTPGETITLPFGPEAHFLAELGDGNLALKVGDVVVILTGYVAAADQTPPVIETADGKPIDIAAILAATDPNVDIQTAAGPGEGGQGADNTGAILQQFGDGTGGLGGFQGAGAQGDSTGPNGGDGDGPGAPSTISNPQTDTGPVNVAPVAADLDTTTGEDAKISGKLPGSDANGDALTYSVVGALPKYVTLDKDGTWSFDPAGHYDALDTGDHGSVTFQYKANDGALDSNTATVTIDIKGVNDAPVWSYGTTAIGFEENDVAEPRGLAPGITDPDDNVFTFALQSPLPAGFTFNSDPASPSVTGTPNGLYDYLKAGEEKDFTLTLEISDGEATSTHDITLKIFGVNDAPVIAGTGTPLGYTENDPAHAIAAAATVKDVDSDNFNGGSLTVSLGATGKAEDQLSIINQGLGAGEIGISGADVTYGGTKIGTWSGGANGADLVIHFTSDDATQAAAQALLRDIGYANSSNDPSAADRTASFTLVDGDGTALGGTDTGTADATIQVTPVNDRPEIVGGLTFFSLSEDTAGNTQTLGLFVQDPDDSVFTISPVGALPTGITYDAAADKFKLDVAGHYDYLKAGESESFIINFQASDGQASSNTWSVTAEILGVNDAPVIGGTGTALSYTEADPARAIAAAGTLSDIDSANFNGGSLTVSLGATGKTEDQLLILNEGTGAGQIGISGADVTYGGTTIGTWSGGANGADLVITFTSDGAAVAAAQELMQHIAYANSSVNPSGVDRTATFTLVDGDGTANGGTDTGTASATIHVTPVNQAPVANDDFFTTNEDTKLTIAAPGILGNDTDPDGNGISVLSLTQAAHGTVTLSGDGSFVYIPFADYNGDDSFTYKASDFVTGSNTATVHITVNPVYDPPVANPDVILTNNGTDLFTVPDWAVLANDKDADGLPLTVGITVSSLSELFLDHGGGQLTIGDTAPLGASFQYGAYDGIGPNYSYTTVSVFNQVGGDLHGTAAHEIVVGSAAGEKIDGGGGKDLIFGGDGDDTLIYHDGDVVQGGGDSVPHNFENPGPQIDLTLRGDILAVDHDVDFTKLDLTHFGGIETISGSVLGAGNGAAQSIAIDAASVASLSDHTIDLGAVFGEHAAIRIDLEAVDQLYLESSKSGDSWIQYGVNIDYAFFFHETTAGDIATTDAYVMVHTPSPAPDPNVVTANVHLNADAP